MRNLWTWLSLIAAVLVIVAGMTHGVFVFLYPVMFLLWFFLLLGSFIFDAIVEASENPELEQLPEPNFWSSIYNAWLYYNKREVWVKYACLFACLGGIIGGSFCGLFVLALLAAPSETLDAVFIGWIFGVFLMLPISVMVSKSDYWR